LRPCSTYPTSGISNGQEAIDQVRKFNPDLIVMDISMPVMNGIDATRQIRLQGLETKIVILSMHNSEETVRLALDTGADACLDKTSSVEKLRDTIFALLSYPPKTQDQSP